MDEWTDGQINIVLDGRIEWLDGWIDGWMDRQTDVGNKSISISHSLLTEPHTVTIKEKKKKQIKTNSGNHQVKISTSLRFEPWLSPSMALPKIENNNLNLA